MRKQSQNLSKKNFNMQNTLITSNYCRFNYEGTPNSWKHCSARIASIVLFSLDSPHEAQIERDYTQRLNIPRSLILRILLFL